MDFPETPRTGRTRFDDNEQDRIERAGKHFKEYVPANKYAKKFTGLCFHCKYSRITRASNENDPTIYCSNANTGHSLMPPNIVECNEYQAVTDMGLGAMVQIAWPIETRDHLKDGYR